MSIESSDDDQRHDTEETPLLQDSQSISGSLKRGAPSRKWRLSNIQAKTPATIVAVFLLHGFIMSVGSFLTLVPVVRIAENVICHHYYERAIGPGHIDLFSDIDESLCKEIPIQEELAIIMGGLEFTNSLPALFVAFPFALLADRLGRKFTLLLALSGIVVGSIWQLSICWFWHTFPLRLLWSSSLFRLIGGGDAVAGASIYALLSDITTEATRANAFLLFQCGNIAAEMVGTPIASWMMDKWTPWLPTLLGIGLIVFCQLLLFFVPETLHLKSGVDMFSPLEPRNTPNTIYTPSKASTYMSQVRERLVESLTNIRESLSILDSPSIILLLSVFFLHQMTRVCMEVALRMISKRFNWKLSDTGFLLSLRAFVNLVLLIAILPLISQLLLRMGLASRSKDLLIARVSILMLGLGSLIIAASEVVGLTIVGLVVYTLGTGFFAMIRSLLTTLVDQMHVARLMAALAVVESIGTLVSGPGLAALFNAGLVRGGPWIGLPFYAVAAACGLAAIAILLFKLPRASGLEDGVERDEAPLLIDEDTPDIGVLNATPNIMTNTHINPLRKL